MIGPIPVNRYLVPDPTALAPEGFIRIDSRISNGVPHTVALSAAERLLLVAPTGVAAIWRSADPSIGVSDSMLERVPREDGSPLVLPLLASVAFRLLYQVNRRTVGVAPLVANALVRLPEASGARARIEVVVLGWRLHAGTLRGAGDYGSFLSLGWRSRASGVDEFSDPPPNPVFIRRQPPERRLQSQVGLAARDPAHAEMIGVRAKETVIIR